MSKIYKLRALVKQILTAAAEEIFVLFERTVAEYEEELYVQQLLVRREERPSEQQAWIFNVQQLLVRREEPPSEQQAWIFSLDQEDPEVKMMMMKRNLSPHSFIRVRLRRTERQSLQPAAQLNTWRQKLMERTVEDQDQTGTQIHINLILMSGPKTLLRLKIERVDCSLPNFTPATPQLQIEVTVNSNTDIKNGFSRLPGLCRRLKRRRVTVLCNLEKFCWRRRGQKKQSGQV
ncbi:uncharacterized protein LOC111223140 [Seriola dumerili]|uniref:uncharacterized protein LOC111223140 n=1 Tax=Seriola dumerili TaxID=41447 RepID=UPI000BBEAF39|nr:uncharacterized protein LOC111223140 [Seriola dumerili]